MSETTVFGLRRYSEEGEFSNFIPDWQHLALVVPFLPLIFLDVAFEIRTPVRGIENLLKFLKRLGVEGATLDYRPEQNYHKNQPTLWGLDVQKAQCADVRDRLYSVLKIVDATDFQVDYSERAVDTFWRAAERFSVFNRPNYLSYLWEVFECDFEYFKRVVGEANDGALRCSIPLRHSWLESHRVNRVLRVLLEKVPKRCAHALDWEGAEFEELGERDVFLCSYEYPVSHSFHGHCDHFILRSHEAGDRSVFNILVDSGQAGGSPVPCPIGTELWHVNVATERRVLNLEDARQLTNLQRALDGDWRCAPHFLLKLPAQYVVESVERHQKGHKT